MKKYVAAVCVFFLAAAALATPDFWTKVSWQTPDAVSLVGLYHPPTSPSALTWVLLHGLGSDKEEWDGFGRALVAQGNGVLIYDARGHNESIHQKGGPDLSYKDFQTAGPWDAMPGDVETAVTMLETRYHLPANRIAVGGASVGANVALAYAAKHSEVPALVLLSPGLQYVSIASETPFKQYAKRPVFLAASPGDQYAFNSVQRLASLRGDAACRVAVGEAAEHGVNMFKNSAFQNKLLDWMKTSWK